jgi:cytidine deaminase
MSQNILFDAAKEASNNSYSPYSGYRVGVALRGSNGKTYVGCNVENISFGACICAERTAIAKMVSDGCREIEELALYTIDGANPCGICLQTIGEFIRNHDETPVHSVSDSGVKTYKFSELFPQFFTSKEVSRKS